MSYTENNPSSQAQPQSFLARVAAAYWKQHGTQVSDFTFVFPYKRAGIFFRKYLAGQTDKPVFAPKICTINELFDALSPYRLADSIDLLFRLYKIYTGKLNRQMESFDDFIFWGRMMLSDFNEIDQHLIPADQLFSSLRDMKAIDERMSELGEEERHSVETFIRDMHSDTANKYRDSFLSLWDCLYPVYTDLRKNLQADGLSYGGMQQRHVVETLTEDKVTGQRYIFIGFNALTETERSLMAKLKQFGKADFYWDYESEWLRDPQNRASFYFEQNTTQFPSRYPLSATGKPDTPEIRLYKVPSATGQAGQIYTILDQLVKKEEADENLLKIGIILPDEGMLLPFKTAIPQQISNINVTMGQQLRLTPVYSLFEHLSELVLQQTVVNSEVLFYYRPVLALLRHPYIYPLIKEQADEYEQDMLRNNRTYLPASYFAGCPLLHDLLFTANDNLDLLHRLQTLLQNLIQPAKTKDDNTEDEFETYAEQNEYIYRSRSVVNRLLSLLPRYPDIAMEQKTLYRILLTLLAQEAVPFEGKPLQGLQIMGVLESRSIDFDTVIMTNCNDDIFPGSPQLNSFIPYDLRCYYHLPTPQREDAVFAYNFYRLISHAKRICLLQNTVADDNNPGEVSRYVYQLRYQYHIPVKEISVSYSPSASAANPPVVRKTADMLNRLTCRIDPATGSRQPRSLSPSALNTYAACPLHFYFGYVERIKEADKITDEIEVNQTGTVIHNVMQQLYSPYAAPSEDKALRHRAKITDAVIHGMQERIASGDMVQNIYCEVFLHTGSADARLSGWDNIMIQTVTAYIQKILRHDLTLVPFDYIGSELPVSTQITLSGGRTVTLYGVADRIDEVNGRLRIVDYKTGNPHCDFSALDTLFSHEENKADHVRQTLCYSRMFLDTTGQNCYPYIYYIKKSDKEFEREICYIKKDEPELHGYQDMSTGFNQGLQAVLEEIFNPAIPFTAMPSDDHCKYCPFSRICGVKKTAS